MGWFIWNDLRGLICYSLGWATMAFVNYTVLSEVLIPWLGSRWSGLAHVACYEIAMALFCASFYRAATTDPGSVEQHTAGASDTFPPEGDELWLYKPKRRFCEHCECIKPPRAHHCSSCRRCVNKMDHHCPWVNNCVGSNNLKDFLLFLLYTFIGGAYSAGLILARLYYCWVSSAPVLTSACPNPSQYITAISGSVVFSLTLALGFMAFAAKSARDQREAMTTDTTGIEVLKRWAEQETPIVQALVAVFGEPLSWRWFAPVAIHQTGPVTGYYSWSPLDDVDAYDPRDPTISNHFKKLEAQLAKEAAHQSPEEAELAYSAARQAARTIYRRHAITRGHHSNAQTPVVEKETGEAEGTVTDIAVGGRAAREKRVSKGVARIAGYKGSDVGLAAAMMAADS